MTSPQPLSVTTRGDREIVISRGFNAPRALVFEAMSQAEFLQRWLSGPPGWSMTECESDLTIGGRFWHVWRNTDGHEMAMRGEYREIVPPERIVRTEVFEFGCDAQEGEQIGTLVLTDQGEQTLLTVTVLYPTREARDGALASGMELGVAASYKRLDDILTSLPAG